MADPAVAEKNPTAHAWHEVAFATLLKLPGSQATALPVGLGQNCPGSAVQAPEGTGTVQAVEPTEAVVNPAGQAAQEGAPAAAWKNPAPQGTQEVEPNELLKLPAGHASQEAAPLTAEKLPGLQATGAPVELGQ